MPNLVCMSTGEILVFIAVVNIYIYCGLACYFIFYQISNNKFLEHEVELTDYWC